MHCHFAPMYWQPYCDYRQSDNTLYLTWGKGGIENFEMACGAHVTGWPSELTSLTDRRGFWTQNGCLIGSDSKVVSS